VREWVYKLLTIHRFSSVNVLEVDVQGLDSLSEVENEIGLKGVRRVLVDFKVHVELKVWEIDAWEDAVNVRHEKTITAYIPLLVEGVFSEVILADGSYINDIEKFIIQMDRNMGKDYGIVNSRVLDELESVEGKVET
jgi:hypothetical protein